MTEQTSGRPSVGKTFKREAAAAVALFWAGLIVWGILEPSTGAREVGETITVPVLMLMAGAFGIDAVFKQGGK